MKVIFLEVERILKTVVKFYSMSIVPLYLLVYNFLCCYKTIQNPGEKSSSVMILRQNLL